MKDYPNPPPLPDRTDGFVACEDGACTYYHNDGKFGFNFERPTLAWAKLHLWMWRKLTLSTHPIDGVYPVRHSGWPDRHRIERWTIERDRAFRAKRARGLM